MAYETLTLPDAINVSFGSSVAYKPRVRKAEFGDGYSQRTGDGLNANPLSFDASFEVLTDAEAKILLDFFAKKKGYIPFRFLKPGETIPRQWIATEWKETYTSKMVKTVNVTLEENFDPQ